LEFKIDIQIAKQKYRKQKKQKKGDIIQGAAAHQASPPAAQPI
jgi:hypothetical protein